MIEIFEDKGTWSEIPITLQGVFENGQLIAVKVLDDDAKPLSWAMTDSVIKSVWKTVEFLYNNR